MTSIMSFDPGLTTGIGYYNPKHPRAFHTFEIQPKKYPHPHEALFDIISHYKPDKVVYEAFHHRQMQTDVVFTGVEFIGVIELYGQLNCLEIVKITPSDGKGFWTDKKLRALGIYKIGLPHGNDAMRILLRHLMKADERWFATAIETLKERIAVS